MAITPQAGYMIDPNNPNAVIRIPSPPASVPTGGMQPGSLVSNQGKPGYDVFGNPVAGTPLPGGGAITSSSLSPAPNPVIPEPKKDTTNWNSIIAGGEAAFKSFTTPSGATVNVPVEKTDLEKRLQTLMGKIGQAPASVEAQYQSAYDTSGIEAAKNAEMAKVAAVRTASAELAGIQAQIKGIVDKRDVQNLTLEKNATGGLITTSFLNRQQQEVNRQSAIEALPLQALALSAQAKVAGLQGEAEYAQSALKMAQDKLDTAFKLKIEDAKNLYEYQKEARTSIFDFLKDEEKNRLAKIQKEDDRNFELLKDKINNAQALSKTAIENGQADIAVQITQLDPKDKEYQQKLGELEGKMKQKPTFQTFKRAGADGKIHNIRQVLDSQGKVISETDLGGGEKGISTMDRVAEINAYAQQYAADGKIPTGMPKELLSEVSKKAQELPKQKGQVLDGSTGLVPAGETTLTNSMSGISSAIELAKQLKELDKERIKGIIPALGGKIIGTSAQQRYVDLKSQIVDLLARARTGAVLTEAEEKFYGGMLPGRIGQVGFGLFGVNTQDRIDNFINNLSADLQNKAASKGWVINGLSKVNLGGKEYVVGQEIEINGVKGRILPNGSIATQ